MRSKINSVKFPSPALLRYSPSSTLFGYTNEANLDKGPLELSLKIDITAHSYPDTNIYPGVALTVLYIDSLYFTSSS